MHREHPFPLLPAPGEDEFFLPGWPPGDAAFARLLLSLAALPPPAQVAAGPVPPAMAAEAGPPPDVAALPAPPALPVPEISAEPSRAPPSLPAPPPRAEELPSPRTEPNAPPSPPEPPAPPSLPPAPLLQLGQQWDPESGLLVWMRNGNAAGTVRGTTPPPPFDDALAPIGPLVAPPPPDLMLIG